MKSNLVFYILFFSTTLIFAQAPVVENVRFEQRTDGSLKVDIYYDLSDSDGENKQIVIEASSDNGATWTLNCASLTGDVGSGVSPGTNKHVEWDFYADNPNTSGSTFKVRVTAFETGTMTDIDGNVYQTVKIGDQWWMAENLRVTHYRDGKDIPHVMYSPDWKNCDIGAYCSYNNSETKADTYGHLYNWFAVVHECNLAPAGWHVPTDAEWTTLTTYLGGKSVAGGKLKEAGTTHWTTPNTGATNESGFTALPGGYRHCDDGNFIGLGYYATFWSASEYSSDAAMYRYLSYDYAGRFRSHSGKCYGYSVRLIRD